MTLYSEKLKHPRWQRKRLEIFQRDNWRCRQCGDPDTELMVHHKVYRAGVEPWEYGGGDLVTLCVNCHEGGHGVIDSFQAGSLLDAAFKRAEAPFIGNLTGVPSGFRFIDRTLGGFQNAELVVVAARPGMGKTAFGLSAAWHAAVDAGVPVALFSLESDDFNISMRIFCARAKMDPVRIKNGHISRSDWKTMTDIMGVLKDAPLFIDTSNDLSLGTIERRIRNIRAEKNLGLAVIDTLQLVGRAGSDTLKIVKQLKSLAKEVNIPIILLSQLDGGLEERRDKRPGLYDLRGSGIVSTADVIIFLYRDEMYNGTPDTPKTGTAEIEIAKNRNGPKGRSMLRFTEQYARFDDIPERPV